MTTNPAMPTVTTQPAAIPVPAPTAPAHPHTAHPHAANDAHMHAAHAAGAHPHEHAHHVAPDAALAARAPVQAPEKDMAVQAAPVMQAMTPAAHPTHEHPVQHPHATQHDALKIEKNIAYYIAQQLPGQVPAGASVERVVITESKTVAGHNDVEIILAGIDHAQRAAFAAKLHQVLQKIPGLEHAKLESEHDVAKPFALRFVGLNQEQMKHLHHMPHLQPAVVATPVAGCGHGPGCTHCTPTQAPKPDMAAVAVEAPAVTVPDVAPAIAETAITPVAPAVATADAAVTPAPHAHTPHAATVPGHHAGEAAHQHAAHAPGTHHEHAQHGAAHHVQSVGQVTQVAPPVPTIGVPATHMGHAVANDKQFTLAS